MKNPLEPILTEQSRLNTKLIDNTNKLIEKINTKYNNKYRKNINLEK